MGRSIQTPIALPVEIEWHHYPGLRFAVCFVHRRGRGCAGLESAKRPLFNGLAQVIAQANRNPGEIRIETVKEGWAGPEQSPVRLVITAKKVVPRLAVA